jgi:methyl-accepting chemotaxis protein
LKRPTSTLASDAVLEAQATNEEIERLAGVASKIGDVAKLIQKIAAQIYSP